MDAHAKAHAVDIKSRVAGRTATTGQIMLFGLTGGLIPCPASITVLLLCLQLKRFTLGAVLVLCFSIGLALTLVSVGAVAAWRVRHASRRFSWFGTLAQRAPYFSGLLIILVGLYTGYQGWSGLAEGCNINDAGCQLRRPCSFASLARTETSVAKAAGLRPLIGHKGFRVPRFSANISMLFTEVPFLDRFEAARQAGFKGVEFQFPYEFGKAEVAERLAASGLVLALHNIPAGDWARADRGIAILPERVHDFRQSVHRAVEYAQVLGCPQLNCLAGVAPEGADPKLLHDTFVANLAFAASELAKSGLRLLIEPINTRDVPGFFLNHTRQAAELIRQTGSENIFIQYDIYHMQIMEGDIARTIEAHLPLISHMQLADNPGRHEPGTGEINYPFLLQHIDRLGYSGWIGCEYKPRTTALAGLGWLDNLGN